MKHATIAALLCLGVGVPAAGFSDGSELRPVISPVVPGSCADAMEWSKAAVDVSQSFLAAGIGVRAFEPKDPAYILVSENYLESDLSQDAEMQLAVLSQLSQCMGHTGEVMLYLFSASDRYLAATYTPSNGLEWVDNQ